MSRTSSLLCLTERVPSAFKDLIKVILEPSNVWRKTSKLPLSIHFLVPVRVGAVSVTLDGDCLA